MPRKFASELQHRLSLVFVCVLLLGLAAGCNRETTVSEDAAPTAGVEDEHAHDDHDHEGHDHEGHDHAAPGPHGGHIVVLDPGHYHVEWVHVDDDNIVEVYLGELAQSASKVQLVAEVQGKEPVRYELEPAAELGAGAYQVKSPNLLTHIGMSDGETVLVNLVVETEQGTLQTELSGDHDHEH